jgi:membrane protein implicated in regulation of membrane protease activity
MSVLLFWIGAGIVFLIVESLTATFYGLALALASAIVALSVWVMNDTSFTLIQGLIFALTSIAFSFFLPNYLKSSKPDMPQWMDKYLGMKRSVKKVGTDMKISLDGVDYLIESEDEIVVGDKVKIRGHQWVSMKVDKLEKPRA